MTNIVYSHPGQPQMQVEVILASRSVVDQGAGVWMQPPVIYTIRMRYPRVIHAEVMTHRLFSRNARSSRAVPVKTMLLETTTMPFVPWHWGANQKGMQAGADCNEPVMLPDWDDIDYHGKPHLHRHNREEAWLAARDKAVDVATAMMEAGYHKQIPNRLLEPFGWIDTLVTSTDWDNFLWLRNHSAAEPHLQDLARLVQQAIDNAVVQDLGEDEWHLPYITDADWNFALGDHTRPSEEDMENTYAWLIKISAARCARISYTPFDGDASYDAEIARYESLVTSDRVHASPTEHQASPDIQALYRRQRLGKDGVWREDGTSPEWENPRLHGNLSGWIQSRKLIPNECHYGR